MAKAVAAVFPQATGALAVTPEHAGGVGNIELLPAGHPLPDEGSVNAVRRQEELLLERPGPCLFLLSGGATALLGAPATPVPLERLRDVYQALLHSGFDIHAMNLIRRHLNRWGGGKFLRPAASRQVISLIVSDVLDDDLRVIGSGPTVADPSTAEQAIALVRKLGRGFDDIAAWLGEAIEETVKPGDPLTSNVENQIVLSNRTVVEAVARKLGGQILPVQTADVGEVASMWEKVLQGPPGVYVAGGEPTVSIPAGATGRGGRNQHLVAEIAKRNPAGDWRLLSIASDGMDGNSGNAGAWIDSQTAAAAKGSELEEALAAFDTAAWCEKGGLAFKTGPTGTNVADVQIALISPKPPS
jgi:hydroxypyruvate reductase